MSIAISPDRKQESTENPMGAPDIAAQQKREHQAASQPSSSNQQNAEGGSGQHLQSGLSETSSQQIGESGTIQQQRKS